MKKNGFTANDYFSASKSRLQNIEHLISDEKNNILTLYCLGVSIECMLKAYIRSYTKEFDSRHDLKDLYFKSQISNNLEDSKKEKLSASIKCANGIWSNNLRYCSEKRLKRILGHEFAKQKYPPKDINKYLSQKRDTLFKIAKEILLIGENKWTYY
jgi:hypothetical protein